MKQLMLLQGRALRSCLFLVTTAVLLSAAPSKAATWGDTDASFFRFWGFSDDWTVFELGSGAVSIQNQSLIYGSPTLTLQSNGDTVDAASIPGATGSGDIGIGGGPGINLTVQLQTQARIGNLITNSASGGTITVKNDGSVGVRSTSSRNLNSDIAAANNASSTLAAMATTATGWTSSNSSLSNKLTLGLPPNYTAGQLNLMGSNQDLTLTATSTTPVVFNIGTFSLNNGAILTLSGSANDEFVFNIYGGNMSVNNHSGIVLTGGLTPADVIYNNIGTGSGPSINNHSYVSGIILATKQSVSVNNQSIVFGAVVSNGLQLNNHSTIESPDN